MPAGAAIPTWDHWCVNPQDQLAQVLAEAGPQGWELVGMTMTNTALFMCFKRPHVAAPPTTPAAAP